MRLLFFLLLFSLHITAQEGDSLLPEILKVRNDTERVNQLYARGFGLRNTNPQLSFLYARRCEEQAQKTGSEKHIAKSYNLLGVLYYKKGDFKKAANYHHQAMELRTACNDLTGIANSEVNLGNIYSDGKLYQKAENAYLHAMSLYKQQGFNTGVVKCLLNLGALKHGMKHYDAAIENFSLAMQMADANDYSTKAACLSNTGESYLDKGDLEKAAACNEDALKLRIMSDNLVETADNYLNLGEISILRKDFQKAKYLIDTACFIAEKNEYFELRYEAIKIRALYYEGIKDYQQAFVCMKRYKELGDSIVLEQADEKQLFDFDETVQEKSVSATAAGGNWWLLIGIALGIIFIPLFLMRNFR
jgi:tetratricopeptide (TPR) repeat protein